MSDEFVGGGATGPVHSETRISVASLVSDEHRMSGIDSSSRHQLKSALLVAVGGFAGAVLRYVTTVALPGGFPWGTLAVNIAGSFALGVLLYEARLTGRLSRRTRLLVGTGFLSSFTTYSTFAAETAALSPTLAVANVGANYALGFAAVLAGRGVVRQTAKSTFREADG